MGIYPHLFLAGPNAPSLSSLLFCVCIIASSLVYQGLSLSLIKSALQTSIEISLLPQLTEIFTSKNFYRTYMVIF